MFKLFVCLILIKISFAQINGVVIDSSGNPIPDANIYINNTDIKVSSDIKGKFKINEEALKKNPINLKEIEKETKRLELKKPNLKLTVKAKNFVTTIFYGDYPLKIDFSVMMMPVPNKDKDGCRKICSCTGCMGRGKNCRTCHDSCTNESYTECVNKINCKN